MFDTKCYDLAKYFLDDEDGVTPEVIDGLAQYIQDAVEEWLGGHEDRPKDAA